MPAWIISLVVGFIVRQVSQYGAATDWAKVKVDADARIRGVVPAWMQQPVVDIANAAIDVVAAALADTADMETVTAKLVSGDVAGALSALMDMVTKVVHPDTAMQANVVAAIQGLQSHVSTVAA